MFKEVIIIIIKVAFSKGEGVRGNTSPRASEVAARWCVRGGVKRSKQELPVWISK